MPVLTAGEILDSIPGCCLVRGSRRDSFSGISTDSRKIQKNQLFVALSGELFDGFDFAEDACNAGAKALVVSPRDNYPQGFGSVITTEDTAVFLLSLAGYLTRKLRLSTIMVTGSCGKTTTKEFLAALLAKKFNVLKSSGNFNNRTGVPLSIFQATGEEKFAVLEIGMNHPGEIREIVTCVKPEFAIVSNVGPVHLEHFQSMAGIAQAKLEILSSAGASTFALLNGRTPLLRRYLPKDFPGSTLFYNWRVAGNRLVLPDCGEEFTFREDQREIISSFVPALILARTLSVSHSACQELLLDPPAVSGRYEILNFKGIKIINDSYNANPVSMECALKRCAKLIGRKIYVLGDMLELGPKEEDYHRRIGRLIKSGPRPEFLFTIGELARLIGASAGRAGMLENRHFRDIDSLCSRLLEVFAPGDIILLKASRKIKLERIITKCFTT
ncbi:MAG: UDP-N-acetylmuramoyl-tripeptide--D-alanyl-D-alanine ligase [Candidatus Wallbacteria bacterium]|nr:UDP-N-acetylmuramoyl-tripeptide--D-alanyl-D-alanine ligase [Candidatus Wallbacteria bacterium]